ncbi:MAG: hypothetical protein PVI06_06285 [Desulfobacterales bacterium]|jgi:2-keto-4-pentenoate hydratase
MSFEKQIQILAKAEKDRKPVKPISDSVSGELSLNDAQEICAGNIQMRLDAGEKLVGYKIGFCNIPVREKMGWPDSMYGCILDSMVIKADATVPMSELIEPKIECEICFKLSRDLSGQNISFEDVLAATEGVSASFEICDSRICDWQCPFPDILADNGFAGRVVLPHVWQPVSGLDLPGETVVLWQNGKKISEGKGEAAMGHPANSVIWLVNKLAERGKGLKAGQFVMTGTLTPILPIEKGATYVASFSSLGEIRVTFL